MSHHRSRHGSLLLLLLVLSACFYSVPGFAQSPPLILRPGGGGSAPTGGGTQRAPQPTLKVKERQYSVLPAPTFSTEEAGALVAMEKALKIDRLANASKVLGTGPDDEIKENRTKGLARWNIMDGMTSSDARGNAARPPITAANGPLSDSYDQSGVAGDPSKPRSTYRNIEIPGMESFQAANREAQKKSFSDLLVTIAGDPTTAAAVGTDVIVGGVVRPFVNAAGKVGEEMVRQVQCASQGQLASVSCGEVTPWQDYWGTLMRGEGEGYTAGALALDAITIGAGSTIAGLTSDAAAAALKKVPEGLEALAKGVGRGVERMKTGYAASGFADQTGAILVGEGERVLSGATAAANTATDIITNARSFGFDLSTLGSTSKIDLVLGETLSTKGAFTSKFRLNESEAMDAGIKWVGSGYKNIGDPSAGLYRSSDGLRQFRIDNNSLDGLHDPFTPHVHFETFNEGARKWYANNHVQIVK